VVYAKPTTVLHSLEAFGSALDFERLLAHQQPDGSFLCSPAATASVYLHTRNPKALAYLQSVAEAFDGGAPNCYPVDLFERLWVVSKIKRLGLTPLLREQVSRVLAYVAEKWSDSGIAWASESLVKEVDDTAVAFRLLREGGYDVSPKALERFCDDRGNFFCFEGELEGGVSHMINLFYASQVSCSYHDAVCGA
jgi:ent-copalyl diphosphate synthase